MLFPLFETRLGVLEICLFCRFLQLCLILHLGNASNLKLLSRQSPVYHSKMNGKAVFLLPSEFKAPHLVPQRKLSQSNTFLLDKMVWFEQRILRGWPNKSLWPVLEIKRTPNSGTLGTCARCIDYQWFPPWLQGRQGKLSAWVSQVESVTLERWGVEDDGEHVHIHKF